MPLSSILLRRGVQRGLLTLKREREYITSLGALFGIALVAQLLLFATIGVVAAQHLLQSQLDLRLQVQDTASDQRIQEFLVAARDLPSVSGVTYITKEQAYQREQERNPELTTFLQDFKIQNPFPDTVAVSLKNLSDYEAFKTFVRDSTWSDVVDPTFLSQATNQEQEVRQMLRVTSVGWTVLVTFLGVVGVVLLFALMELVRRRSLMRQEEIFVERLVGAQDASVLLPFVTEATVLLLVALLLSIAAVGLAAVLLPIAIPALTDTATFGPLRMEFLQLLASYGSLLLLAEVIATPILATVGAYIGMRPQMRREALALA